MDFHTAVFVHELARTVEDPALQRTVAQAFADDDTNASHVRVLVALAKNPNLCPDLRAELANSRLATVRKAIVQRPDVTAEEAAASLKVTSQLSLTVALTALRGVRDPEGVLATYVLDNSSSSRLARAVLANAAIPTRVRLRAAEQLAAAGRITKTTRAEIVRVFGRNQRAAVRLCSVTTDRELAAALEPATTPVPVLPDRPRIAELVAWLTTADRSAQEVIGVFVAERRERGRREILANFSDVDGTLSRAVAAMNVPHPVRLSALSAPDLPDADRKNAYLAVAGREPSRNVSFFTQLTRYAIEDKVFLSAYLSAALRTRMSGTCWRLWQHGTGLELAEPARLLVTRKRFDRLECDAAMRVLGDPQVDPQLRAALYERTVDWLAGETERYNDGGHTSVYVLRDLTARRAFAEVADTGSYGELPFSALVTGLAECRGPHLTNAIRYLVSRLTAAGGCTDAGALQLLVGVSVDFPGTIDELCTSFEGAYL